MGNNTKCTSIPCTRTNPCVICGKTDYCWVGDYGVSKIHFCGRIHDSEILSGGRRYILKSITPQNYAAYEDEEQKAQNLELWKEEQRRTNPDWIEKGRRTHKKQSNTVANAPIVKDRVVVDEILPLSNEALNEIYSYLLELLVLEPEHQQALLKEWNAGIEKGLGEKLLKQWSIRSLPMNDRARKNSRVQLENKTRKQIINAMVKRFKSLRGVPGFYMEKDQSGYYHPGETQENRMHWQMSNISGIVYPQYDTHGNIYRLRIGDEHPVIKEYAKDSNGNYLYYTDKDGKQKNVISATYEWNYYTGEWFRISADRKEKELVWSNQKRIFKVTLNDKGYPIVDGKPDGKYKNFSSRKDMNKEEKDKILVYNRYPEGTRSGSQVSLYCKKGDNYSFVYVTEGEKKAMVMNMILGCPVIALPGVNCYNKLFEADNMPDGKSMFDYLLVMGMKCIIIVFDADKAVNDMVLSSEAGAVQLCREKGVMTWVGEWNLAFGKGADDILIQGNRFNLIEKT